MRSDDFLKIINADFYTGVPDSQLKAVCNYLMDRYGIDTQHHIIAANEGNCVAIAAGYHLATGKVPVVYLQNSGEGNIINPVASLLNEKVYAIPMIFIIGWRGEPGVHDEPQHIFQGEVTLKLLEDMGIDYFVINPETSEQEIAEAAEAFLSKLNSGKSVAYVVRKGALTYATEVKYENEYSMVRERVLRHVVKASGEEPIVCTTGKASRELFEIREENGQSHKYDFLTVGSMGHGSSIALGIAINKPKQRIWCIDGDGAALMHMGSMAVIGVNKPDNLVHIVINNGAHESVGGMPTVAKKIDMIQIAMGCGYDFAVAVDDYSDLDDALMEVKARKSLSLIEAKCCLESRKNLGRPTTTTMDNKNAFMRFLRNDKT